MYSIWTWPDISRRWHWREVSSFMNRPWCHNCKCHNLGMSTNLFHVTSRFISALLGIAMSAPVWKFFKRDPTDQNKAICQVELYQAYHTFHVKFRRAFCSKIRVFRAEYSTMRISRVFFESGSWQWESNEFISSQGLDYENNTRQVGRENTRLFRLEYACGSNHLSITDPIRSSI